MHGSEVETISGTDPPEPFTLCRYKEVSGFDYSRIKLSLVPVFQKKLDDSGSLLVEEDSEFYSSDDDLPETCQLYLKSHCVIAIIPFSVPLSVRTISGQPPCSLTQFK